MSTATMQMQTAPIDGLKIRYADSGTAHGPVILLTSPGQKACSRSGVSGRF